MAGRGADEGRRKLSGSGRGIPPVRARKLRPRGQKSRDGAPIGAHPQPEGARAARRGLIRMRRSALRPLALPRGKERDYGVPGAAKNTGGGALAFYLSPRAGRGRRPSEARASGEGASPRF